LLEKIKLGYAEGVAPSLGVTIAEALGAKDTLATAQPIFGTPLSMTGTTTVNIEGTTGSGGETDIYKFTADVGSMLTFNTFSVFPTEYTTVDTHITIADAGGAGLFTNTDISFSGSSFMTGAGHYSSDSLILNFVAPYTGTYYIGVSAPSAGDYDLLVAGLAVPEPGTVFALGAGAILLLRRRRRVEKA
jgi:hypothetical protein